MSCKYCRGFTRLLGGQYVGDHYTHAPSIQELQKTADDGCRLCALIIQELDRTEQLPCMLEESQDGYPTVVQFVGRTAAGLLNYQEHPFWRNLTGLEVYCGEDGRNDDWRCSLRLYTHPEEYPEYPGIIAGRAIEQYSGSERSVDIIREWEHECLINHPDCASQLTETPPKPGDHLSEITKGNAKSPESQFPKPPSRVIKVDEERPRLYITEENEVGDYITLSHCWGKSQPFTTTIETLSSRVSGFDLADLPKTFQDAITVTRSLSYAYLWIDSLCIVQNDVRDWQVESAKMAQIYQNSRLTIAATASPDCTKGCFFKRDPDGAVEVQFALGASSGSDVDAITINQLEALQLEESNIKAKISPHFFYVCPRITSIRDPLRKSPLHRRGWVLQERMLSRRLIHFASDQLFWECQTLFRSEGGTYYHIIPESTRNQLTKGLRILEYVGPEPHSSPAGSSWDTSILRQWVQLVSQFSQKLLTKESDVFPALAGVASVMEQRLGDEFLAGSWRSSLHLELLWIAFDAPHRSPIAWRAPSWSWAALNGEVEYHNFKNWRSFRPVVEFLHVEAEWTGQAFCSPLRPTAHILVRGLLESARYDPEPDESHLWDITSYHLQLADQMSKPDRYSDLSWAVFDQTPPPVGQVFWCLCLCVDRPEEHYCVLLEPTGSHPDEYRRIGAGRVNTTAQFGHGQRSTIKIV